VAAKRSRHEQAEGVGRAGEGSGEEVASIGRPRHVCRLWSRGDSRPASNRVSRMIQRVKRSCLKKILDAFEEGFPAGVRHLTRLQRGMEDLRQ